jgi:hypothetical protein
VIAAMLARQFCANAENILMMSVRLQDRLHLRALDLEKDSVWLKK